MASEVLASVDFLGDSSETKPSAPLAEPGALFFETDTGDTYIYTGDAWYPYKVSPFKAVSGFFSLGSGGSDLINLGDVFRVTEDGTIISGPGTALAAAHSYTGDDDIQWLKPFIIQAGGVDVGDGFFIGSNGNPRFVLDNYNGVISFLDTPILVANTEGAFGYEDADAIWTMQGTYITAHGIIPNTDDHNTLGSDAARFAAGYINNLFTNLINIDGVFRVTEDGAIALGAEPATSGFLRFTANAYAKVWSPQNEEDVSLFVWDDTAFKFKIDPDGVGIQVGYDVEFPATGALLFDRGDGVLVKGLAFAGGSVYLGGNDMPITPVMSNLPVGDPAVAGQLYEDATTHAVMVSQGA